MYPSSLYVHVLIFYVFITYVFSLNCDDYASIFKRIQWWKYKD